MDIATQRDVDAALQLLRDRARTGGWADMQDLLDACGREGGPLDTYDWCFSLQGQICPALASYTPPIGFSEPGRYRLVA